jgi:hypothetical protein
MAVPYEKIIGSAVAGGAGTVKAFLGLAQRRKASKELESLRSNRPVYTRPEEINDMMTMYQQQAGISQMPGEENMMSRMDASVASSIGAANRAASSSVGALGAVTNVYGQKMNAIRDLATTFAEYKAQRQRELAGAQQVAAGYSDQEWYQNKSLPWQTRMNELTSDRQVGTDAMWGGIQDIVASGMSLAGSTYQSNNAGSSQGVMGFGQTQTSQQNTSAMQSNANNQQMPYNFGSNTTGSGNASSISSR